MQDGRWRGAVDVGKDANGKQKRKVFTAATRHEVADEMKKALHDQLRGITIAPGKLTMGQLLRDWLTATRADVKQSTFVSYENTVRLHLTPAIGDLQLSKLTAAHVQRLKDETINTVVKVGPGVKKPVDGQPAPEPQRLSSSTVRYCLKVLRMALDHACKLDLVPRNVALLVDFPKVEQAEIEPFSPEQAMKFIEATKGHRLGALFSVATAIGLRKKWWTAARGRSPRLVVQGVRRVKRANESYSENCVIFTARPSGKTARISKSAPTAWR